MPSIRLYWVYPNNGCLGLTPRDTELCALRLSWCPPPLPTRGTTVHVVLSASRNCSLMPPYRDVVMPVKLRGRRPPGASHALPAASHTLDNSPIRIITRKCTPGVWRCAIGSKIPAQHRYTEWPSLPRTVVSGNVLQLYSEDTRPKPWPWCISWFTPDFPDISGDNKSIMLRSLSSKILSQS
jgi:hypothetical protein